MGKLIKYIKTNMNKTILLNQVANLIIGLSMAINIKNAIDATNIYDRVLCIVFVCVQIGLMLVMTISLSTYHKNICSLEYERGFINGKHKVLSYTIKNIDKDLKEIIKEINDADISSSEKNNIDNL